MSLKLECHLNRNFPQIEHNSNWNFTQIGMSLKLESHSNKKVTQIGMSLKLEHHLNWNTTQIEVSLKLNVTKIKCNSI